ncbi:MAG: hypothetical protein HY267_07895 [Deltaproteobacteria bacterium]|nr:hypothetical protein [Deltaproteobacteria bacterium]
MDQVLQQLAALKEQNATLQAAVAQLQRQEATAVAMTAPTPVHTVTLAEANAR